MGKGIHHIGLATHDMEKTIAFYEDVLGFPAAVCEMIERVKLFGRRAARP